MSLHFWASSGFVLLDRQAGGGLVLTDDYLRAYLARKELAPPDDACAAERELHARLLEQPRAVVTPHELTAIIDADARENWGYLLAFRDRLLAAPTLEAAYKAMVRDGFKGVPPLFMLQLAHVILRSALAETTDPFVVRAAECLFRSQRVTVRDGTILLADADVVELAEEEAHAAPLMAMLGHAQVRQLDILTPANAERYWQRSDAFDFALDLGGKPHGREALAREIGRAHV